MDYVLDKFEIIDTIASIIDKGNPEKYTTRATKIMAWLEEQGLLHSASQQGVEADAESRCPLYVDYKKSCTAWQHRKRELNRSA